MSLSVSNTNHDLFWTTKGVCKGTQIEEKLDKLYFHQSHYQYIILYQLMQVDHSSFQDNKRATTAVEDGCESRSAQSGSEDAPVYCKFIVTLFLFHSTNYFQFIVSLLSHYLKFIVQIISSLL